MTPDSRPLVLHVLDSLAGGGTQRALVSLLPRFDRGHFRHAVVTLRCAGRWAKELPDDVGCQALGIFGRDRLAGLRLGSVVRRWRPAILHARNTGTWVDTLVASLFRRQARMVLGFHGLDHGGPMDERTKLVARWALRRGAAFAAVSHSGTIRLVEELGIPSTRTATLLNGVDLDRFQPASQVERDAAKRALGLNQNAFVVGWVGSLTPVKRPDLLVEALQLARDTSTTMHAVVVGDGPGLREVRNQIDQADLGERVQLVGAKDDVRPYLAAFDCLVSSSDSEEMSNAVLEALACGVPVVGTDVGDTRTMVRDAEGGVIVERGNSAAIAKALIHLSHYAGLCAGLAAGARRRAQNLSLDASVQGYEQFYSSLWEGRRATPVQPSQTPSMVMSSLCGAAPTNAVTCLRT